MKTAELIKSCPDQIISRSTLPEDMEISGMHYDSRKIAKGNLFFAISGYQSDGNQFVGQALANGAGLVVSENNKIADDIPWIKVANCRRAMALMSAAYLGRPADRLDMIAVTGTAGKTTTTYLLRSIMKEAGRKTGLLGTINYWILDQKFSAPNTTPESLDLQDLLSRMVSAGADTAIMEASSHGIELDRVAGINFSTAVFTNFSQDHLDFHRDMESYLRSKLKLFQNLWEGATAVINRDDPAAGRVREAVRTKTLTFGIDSQSDVMADKITNTPQGSKFRLKAGDRSVEVNLAIAGRHNIYNALAASAAALSRGLALGDIQAGLEKVDSVAGRFEPVNLGQDFSVIVDYAHTPQELEHLLNAARELNPRRIITVFGCGGDRDRSKRLLMGRAVARNSDIVVLTSDNPRTEDPGQIINDILPGLSGREYILFPDRKEAICKSIELARKGDMVIIAGKGHEDYQILGTAKIHFDDREIAGEALKQRLGV
ncbi:MAG: UDP-N-acetylmuramoyl-L-alanyl-D-glutamate--2,6-diaminopimelate ligase [Candidatus Edwardsbacteria bacterium RIFOXYD12_FULL_50_11]|uniref:UDP-N-acetylmuramoyl-L-alanyl-D-glutamate--2,6-diaminopimelate ligase n=1 Tax=Candidatus Edwardsbacteria bacterium GWF2_54_11 TaxID=1817851 RepID=A0A1F5REL1_9BACT|nr:MAG: UDP-N-acetylmuramoyl-L-alanyl-D-glutamate--2,6-diaminopimelate ligase [Candidatus Edwardsbacteria bacterium RifOxyC12_full_54_24]OGF09009.1 MAG: UDP-N-acetylmuramoyl-L-alanyl-D-glutamate--2,6-diaminopimelate ligase [Candidatus Edwardsbacteria bacterium RifOxyA12_full_54_48]OGF12462.1 MAG: UDP-N-acetylmuramoyl-L-alanyl-D-glutamate--2,6-diaminopimelate ligase [Candidatus Edwardsbacteria bacterium GWE2_54_12]OGF12896.1 MAG: UDP-N-acetylmuramoyl-L-alanyl-D-glutamate--2,6-diaminopimelate liga